MNRRVRGIAMKNGYRIRPEAAIPFVLALVTLVLYWPVVGHDFLNYDDGLYITDNARVQAGLTLDNIQWAFCTGHASNWHPITWLSHMIDFALFGWFAGGHHLVNVLFHTANTVLLFLLLCRMTRSPWRCAIVAALFAWHPLRVESVAWVAERKDVLSLFFLLLSLSAYLGYVKRPEPSRYALSLACFALGLMAKPMIVTMPFLLLLLDWWPLGRLRLSASDTGGIADAQPTRWRLCAFWRHHQRLRLPLPTTEEWGEGRGEGKSMGATALLSPALSSLGGRRGRRQWPLGRVAKMVPWRLVREKTPFFALSAASCAVTVWTQHHTGALRTLHAVPLAARVANALTAYAGYLGKLIWPVDLAVLYPMPPNWPLAMVLGSTLALAGFSLFAWRQRNRFPWLAVGWCWFVGTLVPVIGLVQVGEQAMADRYTYFPSIGVFLALTWGAAAILQQWRTNRCLRATAAAVPLSACLLISEHQLGYWRNSRALFEHAIAVTRNNPVAHNNLGLALAQAGREDDAILQYVEALRLQPAYLIARNNLAVVLADVGRVNDAVAQLSEALRQQPNDPVTHNNLGSLLAQRERWPEAIAQFLAALRLQPDYAMARLHLAEALARHGQTAEAIAQYREALRLRPQWPQALDQLAALHATP